MKKITKIKRFDESQRRQKKKVFIFILCNRRKTMMMWPIPMWMELLEKKKFHLKRCTTRDERRGKTENIHWEYSECHHNNFRVMKWVSNSERWHSKNGRKIYGIVLNAHNLSFCAKSFQPNKKKPYTSHVKMKTNEDKNAFIWNMIRDEIILYLFTTCVRFFILISSVSFTTHNRRTRKKKVFTWSNVVS